METPREGATTDRGFGPGQSSRQGSREAGQRRYQAPFRSDGSLHTDQRGEAGPRGREGQPFRREARGNGHGMGSDLKTLIRSLGEDVSQLAHDEMTLAKLELRSVAETLSADVQDAGKALVKDMAKVGVALSLATLAGLALTAGAIMAIGALLGGAYWAGGLIVGAVLAIAAGLFAASAAKDLRDRDSMRLESTRERARENADVLSHEAEETKQLAKRR